MFMRNFEIYVDSLLSFVKLTLIKNLLKIKITEANLKDIALESNTLHHISGPVEQGGLPGLVPVVFAILPIFTRF